MDYPKLTDRIMRGEAMIKPLCSTFGNNNRVGMVLLHYPSGLELGRGETFQDLEDAIAEE